MEKIQNINRLNDVFFKSLLGDIKRKNLTLNFLNDILNKDEQHYFTDINFLDKQSLPDIGEGKAPELDIVAKLNDGSIINIEVQIAKQNFFSKRALFYWARLYAYQLPKGHHYSELKQTISINILNFNHLPFKEYHNSYHVSNDRTHEYLNDDLEMHFIELKKFKISDIKNLRKADSWIAYFSPECTDKEREVIAMTNPAIKEALNYEMIFSQDEIKRREYELQEKAIRDYNATIFYNRKEARKEGIKIGKQEEKYNIAKQMLSDGVDVKFIAKYTNLSIEDIKKLK